MSEVNKDRVRLLVDALRSGKYSQTRGALQRIPTEGDQSEGFCCLGVACEVAIANGLVVEQSISDSDPSVMRYDGQTGRPPLSVKEWYGFEQSNPVLGPLEDRNHATALNDTYAWDFARIADAFEQTFLVEHENSPS